MKSGTSIFLFYVVCFLSLLTFFGCGDTEEMEETSGLVTAHVQETEEPWYKTIDIPDDWYKTKDPNLRNDYFLAILINQFGDIPEVHTIVEYQQKQIQGIPVTMDERTAYFEARARLWPNKKNKENLENQKKFQEMTETKDPEVFAKLFREYLIKKFGDVPEIDILVEVEKKFKADEVVTDGEYIVYLQARFRLFPNESTLLELQQALAEQDEE